MKEKQQSIEEILVGIPHLLEYFQNMEQTIKKVRRNKKNSRLTKENLIKKRDALLETIQSLTIRDLKIIYYIYHLDGIDLMSIYYTLRRIFQKQCDFKNKAQNKEAFFDLLRIGGP